MKHYLRGFLLSLAISSIFFLYQCGKSDKDTKLGKIDSDGIYNFQEEKIELNKRKVTLYFPSLEDNLLHSEERKIFNTESISNQAKQTIVELVKGTGQTNLFNVIPRNVKLNELYLDQQGTAYIDFSKDIMMNSTNGSMTEILIVYSIVNTLMENFEDIKRIRILVDGKEVRTLLGHLDLTIPLKYKPALIFVPSDETEDNFNIENTKPDSTDDDNN